MTNGTAGGYTTLRAPLGHINVHIRDGSVLLLHSKPGYTTAETRRGPYSLLVSLSKDSIATGSAYLDDGVSLPPGPSKTLAMHARTGRLSIQPRGKFVVPQKLDEVVILGVMERPKSVEVQGRRYSDWMFSGDREKLLITNLDLDLNVPSTIEWTAQ